MALKDIWEGIAYVAEEFALVPLNFLRDLELESWFAANTLNWIFMIIGSVAFGYWMKQLAIFNENKEENRSVVSHSFLAKGVQGNPEDNKNAKN